MPQTQDPYLDLADAALAAPPPEDPYLQLADAALADEGAGIGDYAALPVRGAMEGVIGPLSGAAGMGDALGRALGLSGPEIAPEVRKLRQYEPEIHPEAEQSLTGQVLQGIGQVGTMVAGSMLLPGAYQAGAAGAAMGAQSFGQAQERAAAEGATPEQADLEGLLSAPAGFLEATPIGRGAAVFSRAKGALAKTLAGGALKEGTINAGVGAIGNAWREAVHQSITGPGDVQAIFEAAKSGLLPDALIGGALGGAMRWSASRAGPLSPEGLASVDAAAQEAAAGMAKGVPDAGQPEDAAPLAGQPAEDGPQKPTLIEVPDEALAAATERFQKSIKRAKPIELHEAPEAERARAAEIGLRLVEVDGGEPLRAAGYYDAETRTAFIDRRAGDQARRSALREHETVHFMESAHPDLAGRWSTALDAADPKWQQEAAKARRARHKAEGLPGLSEPKAREEARAEAAEGLSGVLDLLDARPDLIAKVAQYEPGLIRTLIDATIDLANRLKLTKRTSISSIVASLDAELRKSGTDFEKRLGAQKASKLALDLRRLHRAMRVEEPLEQPRANEKPSPFLKPEPITEAQGPRAPPVPGRADLVEGLPADRAAAALGDLDTRIEQALVRGEGLDTPRLKELAKDRATAQKLLYEAEPDHPLLGREDPITVWKKIVADDEAAVATARKKQADDAKQAEKTGAQRSRAVQAATRKLERELARAEKDAVRRQRAEMAKKAKEEAEFRKLLAEEERAKKKTEPKPKAKSTKPASEPSPELLDLRRRIAESKAAEEKARAAEPALAVAAKPAEDPLLSQVEEFGKKNKLSVALVQRAFNVAHARATALVAEVGRRQASAEPAKPKLPVARRERIKREELQDPHIRRELERMMETAGWETEGGKAFLKGTARNERGDRGTTKWIPNDPWFKEIPDELKMNAADARHAIDSALKDYPLGAKQRAFVEWAIDRADGELYQGATGETRAEARRAYDEMLAKPPPEPEGDVPFALPLKRKGDSFEDRIEAFVRSAPEGVDPDDLRRVLRNGGRIGQAFPLSREAAEAQIRRGIIPPYNPAADSEKGIRLRGLARLFYEQESALKQAANAAAVPFQPTPSARRDAYAVERRAQTGWLSAFQEGISQGLSQTAAAKAANEAHPAALRPARFLAGFDDPSFDESSFALGDDRPRDAAGLREWLRRYEGTEPHYAVTSKGEVTKAARAVAEQFWEKEERTKASMQRAAREMLASKAGKAEVDAAIRGERSGDWREQSDLTVAAEMRVNAKLRAAATGAANVDGAIDLAVDYYLLRSEQGRALSSVQRPRDARESFYTQAAKPSPEHAEELSSIASQMKGADAETRAKLKQRVAEIKQAEAKRFEAGMLALQKAGLDPETMPNTSLAAAHAYRIFALGTNKGFWDPILEMRASAMISHPATTFAALGGNVANVGWNTVLMRLAELPVPEGATVGEMKAIAAAMPGAFNKAWNALKNVVATDTPSYEAQLHDLGLIKSAQAFENAKLASIKGKKGRFVRIPLTAMTAVDEFARALGTELEAVGIAYRRAKGDTAKMVELLDRPAVWEEAVKRARRSIFQEREGSPLVELGFTAREALDKATGGTVPAGNLIFPFVQTGVNGLLEGLRKLPGTAQLTSIGRLRKGGWRDPEIRAQETARFLLSTALAVGAYGVAGARDEEGRYYITGTSTDSNDPPMSWQTGDGQWRSYSKLMPFSTVLATLVDGMRAGLDIGAMAHSILKQGVDQTYFNSMAGILTAIESKAPPDAKLARFGRDFATSFVPNVARGMLTAFDDTQTVDPMRRHEGDSFGVLDSLRLRVGLDDGVVRYDNFGRPIEKGGSDLDRYLNPVPPNRDVSNEHTADKVIRNWNLAPPEGEKPWVPQKPRYWYEVKGETRYMSDAQYAEFQRRSGEIASSMLDEATLDPKNPTKAQIERIKRVLSKARARAKKEVLRNIPYDEEPE